MAIQGLAICPVIWLEDVYLHASSEKSVATSFEESIRLALSFRKVSTAALGSPSKTLDLERIQACSGKKSILFLFSFVTLNITNCVGVVTILINLKCFFFLINVSYDKFYCKWLDGKLLKLNCCNCVDEMAQ